MISQKRRIKELSNANSLIESKLIPFDVTGVNIEAWFSTEANRNKSIIGHNGVRAS